MKRRPRSSGSVHIYAGSGKGQRYGEAEALCDNPHVTLERSAPAHHIHWDAVATDELARAHHALELAPRALLSGPYTIVVLGEVDPTRYFGLLETEDVLLNRTHLLDQHRSSSRLALALGAMDGIIVRRE